MLLLHNNLMLMVLLHDNFLHNNDDEWSASRPSRAFDYSYCSNLSLIQRFYAQPTHSRPLHLLIRNSTSHIRTLNPHTRSSQLQTFFTQSSHHSFRNSTLHIRSLNLHTCNLKHFSLINEIFTLSRCMGEKDLTVKANERETKKDRVKLREAPKSVHFQISP